MLDWGIKSFRTGTYATKIPPAIKFLALLDEFRPSAVVIKERMPPKRKIWQSEDYRTRIFDAAALGVAYFTRRKPSAEQLNT